MFFVVKHEQSRLTDQELSLALSEMVAHVSGLMDSSALAFQPVFSSDVYSAFEIPDSPFLPKLRGLAVTIVDFYGAVTKDSAAVIPINAIAHYENLGASMVRLQIHLTDGVLPEPWNFEIYSFDGRGALFMSCSESYTSTDRLVELLSELDHKPAKH